MYWYFYRKAFIRHLKNWRGDRASRSTAGGGGGGLGLASHTLVSSQVCMEDTRLPSTVFLWEEVCVKSFTLNILCVCVSEMPLKHILIHLVIICKILLARKQYCAAKGVNNTSTKIWALWLLVKEITEHTARTSTATASWNCRAQWQLPSGNPLNSF